MSTGKQLVVLEKLGDLGCQVSRVLTCEVLPVPLDDHAANDRVANRQERADKPVKIGGEDPLVGGSQPAFQQFLGARDDWSGVSAGLQKLCYMLVEGVFSHFP